MRNHKGNEKEYIQNSLKECRREVRSPDMDNKATALLKLVYLEMFGHDMSWASFNVLEVMSSQKYLQKRVGYLAAVQTFRPDTEVLMLAENLLKKDLNSPQLPTIGLPLVTIPHVVNPSMANSLLTDLLPRLTHSSPAIRKKTIVTLYRLALVYPETLRPAWPKIKERLLDENEDSSVTAAIINVVCELGWRRPHDFLPLAPRLFELLVQGSNNWMAIKIIKLFATLVPLEPRLIKKLLPPLTTLIKTTPAMSLLYECINGIIQGGILDGAEGTVEGDEIARLCVSKLRGMLVVEGDPNLKYVALLAFTKIVASHPQLVALHSDVVVECIDDPDISIRTRALELVSGMVDGSNLMPIVERLLRQLREATPASASDDPINDRGMHGGVVPSGDSDDEEAAESLRRREARSSEALHLPEDYRQSVIENILDMCSRDTYANISDFEWYIGILVDLVGHCPTVGAQASDSSSTKSTTNVAQSIGLELQNVAVRVKSVRPEAVAAAQSLIIVERRRDLFPASGNGAQAVLASVAWMVGEYPDLLPDPQAVLSSLLHTSSAQLPASILAIYIQAIPKVFARLTSNQERSWTASRKSQSDLLMARIIHFLEPLLMRVTSEAIQAHAVEGEDDGFVDPPLLLTQAIPSLFMGQELNPVASGALSKVPLTDGLDLDTPINDNLQILLSQADYDDMSFPDEDNVSKFYFEKPSAVAIQPATAADYLEPKEATQTGSYQSEDRNIDPKDIAKKKAERRERYRDDPFYIDSERVSGTSTPLHNILKSSNGEELDIDSIPIMDLQLDSNNTAAEADRLRKSKASKKSRNKRVEIAQDETIGDDDAPAAAAVPTKASLLSRPKKSLLHVDSSGLSSLSLSENATARETQLDFERRQQEEEEMAKAIKEVERARLEMQRAQERVEATHIPEEGTLAPEEEKPVECEKAGDDAEGTTAAKKKKKKKAKEENVEEAAGDAGAEVEAATVKTKRKKKRQINFDEQGDAPAA
ncbi:unnamed protein product [Aureobasidium pullulans]|nr:unnamed protein product [Aureobasidium pullulans]